MPPAVVRLEAVVERGMEGCGNVRGIAGRSFMVQGRQAPSAP